MREEDAVLAANRAFYEAFGANDTEAMDALWAREHLVACIHPGWEVIHGRELVLSSWRAILAGATPEIVSCDEARAIIVGDTAFVTCVESIVGNELVATNVFTLEHGAWRLVHHHAAPFARTSPPEAHGMQHLN